jgi:hypothetical protein
LTSVLEETVVDEPKAGMAPILAPAESTEPVVYWTVPGPELPPSNRRIGWVVVGLGAGALAAGAAYAPLSAAPSSADPDWGFAVPLNSPQVAAATAVMTGLPLARWPYCDWSISASSDRSVPPSSACSGLR